LVFSGVSEWDAFVQVREQRAHTISDELVIVIYKRQPSLDWNQRSLPAAMPSRVDSSPSHHLRPAAMPRRPSTPRSTTRIAASARSRTST
jgi:hypothetical protein